MPQCLKCGAELPVNEEGMAPVLCDRCAGRATRRARVGMNSGTLREFPATTILVGINIAVFLGMLLTSGSLMGFSREQSVLWGANDGFRTLSGDYWRLVTAGFVHANLLHIGFNMWCLWSLGQLSERLFGRWITFAVYILTGVGGALLSVGVDPSRFEVGASGAVFGIAGAILSGIKFGNVAVSSVQKRQIMSSMIFFVIFNLAFGAAIPGIDNWCHLGGLISGLIFGVPLATASATGKKPFEWATIAIAALVMAGIGAQVVQAKGFNDLRSAQEKLDARDIQGGIAILERAAAKHPNSAMAQGMLGQAYDMNGERDKAMAAYGRALQLEPRWGAVRARMEQLQKNLPNER
jgi:rhomboid protease GluP